MGCDGFATLKTLELAVCIVCVVLKRFTDYEALNVFFRLQKLSREWPFLNNITWEENGSSFADITYGGFVIITAGLLLGYVMGELRRARKMEVFFLVLGVIMYAIMGGLVLAALEFVPPQLVDNAAALGAMSLVAALLFILDLVLAGKRPGKYKRPIDQNTQTIEAAPSTAVDLLPVEVDHKVTQTNGFVRSSQFGGDQKNHGEVIHELRSSLKGSRTSVVQGPNMYGESPDLTRGQKGLSNGGVSIIHEGYDNRGFNIVEHGEKMNFDAPPKFEKIGHATRKISESNLNERRYSDEFEKQGSSHNLERFRRSGARRSKKAYSSAGSDYEYDEFLHMPTVSFLLAERGEMERRRSLGSKSVEKLNGKGSHMLSMMPIMSEENDEYFRRSRSIDQLVRKEDIERERRDLQKQREEFARERELYLMNSRKYKEQLAREVDRNRKMQDSSPDFPDGDYRNTASTTPETGLQRKKSVTIQDMKSPGLADEVQEKLSRQGFVKLNENELKRSKNVGFTKYDYDDDDKYHGRKHVGIGTESPTPELIAIQKKSSAMDHDRRGYSGTPTPDYDRPSSKKLTRRLDSNASDHFRYDSRDANRNFLDDRHNPSTPSDPGFVLHAANNWPDVSPKTPSQSPSERAQYRTSSDEDYRPVYDPPMDEPPSLPAKQRNGRSSDFRLETPQQEGDDYPKSGSITTQLLQKWLKQRHTKVDKMRSNP